MAGLPPDVEAAAFPPPKRVAVIGCSPDPRRPSHEVATALEQWGYSVFRVNPNALTAAGQALFASLDQVPGRLDVVVVFRRSERVRDHEPEILKSKPALLWLQEGVRDDDLAARVRAAGTLVVQDDCIARRYAEWLSGRDL